MSEKHYLMIPDELWDKAARWVDANAAKCAAECAAQGACTEAQEVADHESDNAVTPSEKP